MVATYIARSKDEWDNFKTFVWDKMEFPTKIEYKNYSGMRSLGQNALFHMWCQEAAQFFIRNGKESFTDGSEMNKPNMKRHLKTTFLGHEEKTSVNLKTGEIIKEYELRHTSDLETGDMHYFMNRVEEWAMNFNIPLTKPVDCEYEQLKRMQDGQS